MNLDLEREGEDVEERQEGHSDDDFEPEDGLEDLNFRIDPGFVKAEETAEPERQRREGYKGEGEKT